MLVPVGAANKPYMVEVYNVNVHPVPFNYHLYPNIMQNFFYEFVI